MAAQVEVMYIYIYIYINDIFLDLKQVYPRYISPEPNLSLPQVN